MTQWPDDCPTCGKKQTENDLCSNPFHLCRDCKWQDGVNVMVCRKCEEQIDAIIAEMARLAKESRRQRW